MSETEVALKKAHDEAVRTVSKFSGLGEAEAGEVVDFYIAKGFLTLDPVSGTAKIKHGAYYDRDALLGALIRAREPRRVHGTRGCN